MSDERTLPGDVEEWRYFSGAARRCVLEWCADPADAGRWCRRHWDGMIERDVQIEAFQPSEYLARELVQARRQVDFLVQQSGVGNEFGACCGHMLRVHAEGGCFGQALVGQGEYGGEYAPCKCRRWVAVSEGVVR